MKCLVVSAHPLENSLCHHLTSHVETALLSMGHEVMIEDLYGQHFNPVLTPKERQSYYSEQYNATVVQDMVTRLQQSEALILLFPTWWFGFPAILKGWFDRVWGPGIAYDHATDFGPIKPRLNNLRQVVVITTLGSPAWVDRLVMWQPVKRIIRLALLGACAKKSRMKYLSLYNSEKLSTKTVNNFIRKIEKALSELK
jgi:NAD(P)H dehydrogenase (quinone)